MRFCLRCQRCDCCYSFYALCLGQVLQLQLGKWQPRHLDRDMGGISIVPWVFNRWTKELIENGQYPNGSEHGLGHNVVRNPIFGVLMR